MLGENIRDRGLGGQERRGEAFEAVRALANSIKSTVSRAEIDQLPGGMQYQFVDSFPALEQFLSDSIGRKAPIVEETVDAYVVLAFAPSLPRRSEKKLDQPTLRDEHALKNYEQLVICRVGSGSVNRMHRVLVRCQNLEGQLAAEHESLSERLGSG
jgi:hypothetical protein